MTLQNLVTIGRLEPHETDAAQVTTLLEAGKRGIRDAKEPSISLETRFDAAYRAVMQCAMVALWANGYRPLKSAPGHHQTVIQSLVTSIDLERDEMRLLDTFRIKRNAIDYTGELMDEGSVNECIEAAESLLRAVTAWLTTNRPELLRE